MAETNLESHGTWMKFVLYRSVMECAGECEAAVVDRDRTNFEVLKNHTSILFWSLGMQVKVSAK